LAITWAWVSRPITTSHGPVRPSINALIDKTTFATAAQAPCVLRDASLRDAPQDEEFLCMALKVGRHPEELAKPVSRRTR
jgi:hypothetical protein